MNPAFLVFAVLFGVAGWQESRRFERQYGRTPWGWDPLVWAFVMFLSFVIGVVLIAIAERQGRSQFAKSAVQPSVPVGQYGYGGVASMSQPGPGATPSASIGAPAPPPAGFWAPDPSGRFEHRWWDGQQWTNAVSQAGVVSQDPPTRPS